MSEWQRVRLGEVMSLDVETVQVQPDKMYPVVGVLNRGRGLLYRESVQGRDTKYKTLNVIRPDRVIYSRLKAFEGAITVLPGGCTEAYASQEFPTFSCGPRLLPAYFRLITTTPRLWADLQNLSTGMGGRRERVKPQDFLGIPVTLPPVPEQRRIADIIAGVDAHIIGLEIERDTVAATVRALAEHLLVEMPSRRLGGVLAAIEGGRSPMTTGEPPAHNEEGVLKVSAVTPGRFVPEESKALLPDTSLPEHARVRPGDVLMTRANTPDRVGAVCRVPADVRGGLFLSDKTLRLLPDADKMDPDFLVVAMATKAVRAQLAGSATGTSASMFNVSQTKIRSLEIPVPNLADQRRVVDAVNAAAQSSAKVVDELSTVRSFRSTLLAALLSQSLSIPESYDRLLDSEPGLIGMST